jgi:hypothetical protein
VEALFIKELAGLPKPQFLRVTKFHVWNVHSFPARLKKGACLKIGHKVVTMMIREAVVRDIEHFAEWASSEVT